MSDQERPVYFVVCADISGDALGKLFLQHVRDFDSAHPGCHFQISAVAMEHTTDEITKMLEVVPPFGSGIKVRGRE